MEEELSEFKKEISSITESIIITEDKVMTAYYASLIKIKTSLDAFYFCASINLLNTYVKNPKRNKDILSTYKFKRYLLKGIEGMIINKVKDVEIYVSNNEDVVYIKIFNFQFSFHNVGNSSVIEGYKKNNKNVIQEWEGLKLQPISVIIFDKALELRKRKSKTR
tara:strand:- start:570 stop:1061 length:492 start_codon:yes stop_codon:yes gene_type:complete